MIALVPISRFRVTYDVAMGRPYSQLEALVLSAVAGGATTVDQLQSLFHVHRRLLVEALVTLTQAGWLAIGTAGGQAFVLTAEGDVARRESGAPRSRIVDNRTATVIMERITGACVSNDAIRYLSNREVDSRRIRGLKIPSHVGSNRLTDAEVHNLLPKRQGEWIHWIGPIDQDSKLNHWLPVSIDPDLGGVVGLPDEWRARLTDHILDDARRLGALCDAEMKAATLDFIADRRERRISRPDSAAPRLPDQQWQCAVRQEDFLYSASDHIELLRSAFREAESSLLVMSAFLSLPSAQMLKGDILKALQRGVNIDLMWGYALSAESKGDATVWLKNLANSTKESGVRGVLRLNETASRSHAKVLLWDSPTGFKACVGSFNWLSTIAEANEQ